MYQGGRLRPSIAIAGILLILTILACGSQAAPTLVSESTGVPPTEAQADQGEVIATVGATAGAPPTAEPTVAPPTSYKVGDIISIGDVVLVVLGWNNPPGNEVIRPDAGNVFVAVDVMLVNQSASPIAVTPVLQMELRDETFQAYTVDLSAVLANGGGSPDGEINPGERIRGDVGFQVPQTATGLELVFDASLWGTGKLFIELGPQPVALDPPAELPGETLQTTYSIGNTIEVGEFTLTVNGMSSPPGEAFNVPDPGSRFVVVDLTIQNRSTAAVQVASLFQMSLKDRTGKIYDVNLKAFLASGGASPDGELAPGETVRGQVGFQVPQAAEGLVFVFDADVWSTGKALVQLP